MNDYSMNMFSIPFSHIQVRNWKEKKKLLSELSKDSEFITIDTVKTSYSHINTEQLVEKLYDILDEEFTIFSEHCGWDKHSWFLTGAWFQIQDPGMFHQIHNHGHTGFSCVCYLDYDKNSHTPTKFIAPYYNFISGETIYFTPENIKEGSLIIFPSFLNHYTVPNSESNKQRKILSFNIEMRY